MAEFRLYCLDISGNAYKAALMLELSGCDWEPVAVRPGEMGGDGFRREINELGEIPVLDHQGRILTQSGVILTYLAELTGRFKWQDETERLEVLRWILYDNHKFTGNFATLRYMAGILKTGETPLTEFFRGRAANAFGIVDRHLATRAFVVGDRPTIADFSMAGYMFYTEETGLDRGAYPHLSAWIGRIAALPGWKGPFDLMPKAAA